MVRDKIIYEAVYSGLEDNSNIARNDFFSDDELIYEMYKPRQISKRFEARGDDEAVTKATSKNLLNRLGLKKPVLRKIFRLEEIKLEMRVAEK